MISPSKSPKLTKEAYADVPRDKAHFPFLKLPGERRNMIYELVLVTGESELVYVQEMDIVDSQLLKASGFTFRRTTYLVDTYDAGCIVYTFAEFTMPTTYEYVGGGTALLSVCRQINTEAARFFTA